MIICNMNEFHLNIYTTFDISSYLILKKKNIIFCTSCDFYFFFLRIFLKRLLQLLHECINYSVYSVFRAGQKFLRKFSLHIIYFVKARTNNEKFPKEFSAWIRAYIKMHVYKRSSEDEAEIHNFKYTSTHTHTYTYTHTHTHTHTHTYTRLLPKKQKKGPCEIFTG